MYLVFLRVRGCEKERERRARGGADMEPAGTTANQELEFELAMLRAVSGVLSAARHQSKSIIYCVVLYIRYGGHKPKLFICPFSEQNCPF